MEFATPAVQAAYERIAPLIKELFGEFVYTDPNSPIFGISIGSAYAQIAPSPYGNDDATIRAWSWVVTGAETTPELMLYLLNANVNLRFGGYGIDDVGDILFHHTIMARTCDKEELRTTIMAVISTADRADDEIIAKFGGQRSADRSRA